jgi:hypothetical protein
MAQPVYNSIVGSGTDNGTINATVTTVTGSGKQYLTFEWNAYTAGGSPTVSTATFDGVAMTKIDERIDGNHGSSLWGLAGPSIGAKTLHVVLSKGAGTVYWVCRQVDKVAQSNSYGSIGDATGNSAHPHVTLAAYLATDYGLCTGKADGDFTVTAGANETLRYTSHSAALTNFGTDNITSSSGVFYETINGSAPWIIVATVLHCTLGSQIWLIEFRKLIDDLKKGLLPPQELKRRLEKVKLGTDLDMYPNLLPI